MLTSVLNSYPPRLMPMTAAIMLSLCAPMPDSSVTSPPATVAVVFQGANVPIEPAFARQLRSDLEELLSGCSLANEGPLPEQQLEFEVQVDYPSPITLPTVLLGQPRLQLRRIIFGSSPTQNDGWPLLYGVSPSATRSFFKCSGAKTLDILCTSQLERFALPSVARNCHLAPSRRRHPPPARRGS